MTRLNMEGKWSQDPEPDPTEPTDMGVDGDWLDDIFDDEYIEDDTISEEDAMDWAFRFSGEL